MAVVAPKKLIITFQQCFLDIKQNSDMKFPSWTVNVSLWVVDKDFLDTESTWIWIVHLMNCHLSLYVIPGDKAFATQ